MRVGSLKPTPAPFQAVYCGGAGLKPFIRGILLPPPLAAYVKPCISHCSLWDLGVERGMEEFL